MRKVKKSQILEIIGSLKEVHGEIHKLLKHKDYHTAQSVLADCQQGAIEIGEAIEKSEGEGCLAVREIESYCETVFQLYQQIEQLQTPGNCEAQEVTDELSVKEDAAKKALEQVLEAIVAIKVRKEVAFFPYKASMWDSLESVYLAAKEDPDCDAYCVPIPYFDRKPDGSFAQMHYEGREYPKNIEVIDWKTYNFEERKPDTIYIHNPYDDGNYVTCVHPRFFSANLKKYTEELVYIPYFVLDEIDPNDQKRIDEMKHFVWTVGVIRADKVILQSEAMRQIYINEYFKAAKQYGLTGKHQDRSYLEKKFLGLGSPKFDKVLNTKKEDLEIPEEWLKIIQKPDGSWKKIIFYNTTVAALLEHNEKMLEKMRDVFRIFKENKDEVALLWRPHPLIQATIESMRPQLWHDYEQLLNRYQAEGWGIYDDTADMDRAVVLSDAYYGDASSVVQVYQKTGKPGIIQDVKQYFYNDNPYLMFSDLVFTDVGIYAVSKYINGLWKIDIEKNEINLEGIFSEESLWGNGLFERIIVFGKKLYLIPSVAKKLYIYDCVSRKMESLDLKMSGKQIVDALQVDGTCYMVPWKENYILKIDLATNSIEKINLDSIIGRYNFNKNKALFRQGNCIWNNKIVVPLIHTNAIIFISIETDQVECRELEEAGKGITCVFEKDNTTLYVLDCNNILYEYQYDKRLLVEEALISSDRIVIDRAYKKDSGIRFFPTIHAHAFIDYNINDKTVEQGSEVCRGNISSDYVFDMVNIKDVVYYSFCQSGEIVCFNGSEDKVVFKLPPIGKFMGEYVKTFKLKLCNQMFSPENNSSWQMITFLKSFPKE